MRDEMVDLVVGAGSGMGAAAARALTSDRRLLLVDRDLEAAERLAAEIGAEAVECDLTDLESIEALSRQVGRIGSMIVTAGVSGPPGEVTLAINLIGYEHLLNALDHAVGEGTAVVLFASMVELFPFSDDIHAALDEPLAADFFDRLRAAGVDPSDPGLGYALSKVGVVRLVRRLSPSWWQRGARIVSVSPGVIDTPMLALTVDTPQVRQMKSVVGRFGRPEEVGDVAAFLVSDTASYVTGINVSVDGGYQTAAAVGAGGDVRLPLSPVPSS